MSPTLHKRDDDSTLIQITEYNHTTLIPVDILKKTWISTWFATVTWFHLHWLRCVCPRTGVITCAIHDGFGTRTLRKPITQPLPPLKLASPRGVTQDYWCTARRWDRGTQQVIIWIYKNCSWKLLDLRISNSPLTMPAEM